MGEAKRRAAALVKQEESLATVDIPRLAAAIRKLATAASGNLGSDCYIHSAIAQAVLGRLGVEAKLVVGHAAFRVGDGDSDVITHAPTPGMIPQPGGIAYHVWLQIGSFLLDLTTYQLRRKAAQLDQLDGGNTTVTWCPDVLWVPFRSVSTLRDVIHLDAGLYYYREVPSLAAIIVSKAPALDPADVEAAWMLYQNEDMLVCGPNDTIAAINENGYPSLRQLNNPTNTTTTRKEIYES